MQVLNVVVIILPEVGACPVARCFLLWCAYMCWSFRLPHDGKGHRAAINHFFALSWLTHTCNGEPCLTHFFCFSSNDPAVILNIFFFRFCSFTPSVSEITFKGCKWLQPSSWHVRRAERLIFFALKSSRIAQHFFFLVVFLDIFRVTGRIIISRECGWHTGRIFKNVKSVPDLYKRVEQTHKSVSECQHD